MVANSFHTQKIPPDGGTTWGQWKSTERSRYDILLADIGS